MLSIRTSEKKISNMLWNYCRGIDHSAVEDVQETKSVGAEVNWGVRFNEKKDACPFFHSCVIYNFSAVPFQV